MRENIIALNSFEESVSLARMTIAQAQLLLRIAKFAGLDPRNRRDSVILYSLNNALTVDQANEVLYDTNELTI